MTPKVGISAVLMTRTGYVLLGERLTGRGKGLMASPGGHLEWGEDLVSCALRELREETGVDLQFPFSRADLETKDRDALWTIIQKGDCQVEYMTLSQEITHRGMSARPLDPEHGIYQPENPGDVDEHLIVDHYVTLYMQVLIQDRIRVENLEPHKHGNWYWYSVNNLPSNMWKPLDQVIQGTYHSLDPVFLTK